MPITKEAAIQKIKASQALYVAYSQATRLPYVTCDEETFNDQVWFFASEKGLQQFGQQKMKERIPLAGMKVERKNFNRFFSTLAAIDVNEVVWVEEDEKVGIELEQIVRLDPRKKQLFNPSLQLCGIYFMQEIRRPIPFEKRPNLREQEEELMVNLRKAQLFIAMEVSEEDVKKISIPYMKNKDGDIIQPAFTDVMELELFAGGRKLRAARVAFDKLPGLMLPQSKYIVINPRGFNLLLNREQLKKIASIKLEDLSPAEGEAPEKDPEAVQPDADPVRETTEEAAEQTKELSGEAKEPEKDYTGPAAEPDEDGSDTSPLPDSEELTEEEGEPSEEVGGLTEEEGEPSEEEGELTEEEGEPSEEEGELSKEEGELPKESGEESASETDLNAIPDASRIGVEEIAAMAGLSVEMAGQTDAVSEGEGDKKEEEADHAD